MQQTLICHKPEVSFELVNNLSHLASGVSSLEETHLCKLLFQSSIFPRQPSLQQTPAWSTEIDHIIPNDMCVSQSLGWKPLTKSTYAYPAEQAKSMTTQIALIAEHANGSNADAVPKDLLYLGGSIGDMTQHECHLHNMARLKLPVEP